MQVINDGFKMIEDKTRMDGNDCILFKRRTTETNYIKIEHGQGCNSYVKF